MRRNKLVASAVLMASFTASADIINVQYDNFADVSKFQLNGKAAELNSNSDNVLRLTNGLEQASSAFLTDSISLRNEASFSSFFSFRFHNPLGLGDSNTDIGADGIVFTLQTQSNTAGTRGVGIGYRNISNSLGIEFDTYFNSKDKFASVGADDPDGNHLGINLNGAITSVATKSEAIRFNNGSEWNVWVDYDGTKNMLDVRYSLNKQRPTLASLTYNVDLESTFGSNNVFVGFTSGTGAGANTHDINSFKFTNDFRPIEVPEPNTIAFFGLALAGIATRAKKGFKLVK